jgi:hypothetical protein
MRGARNTPLRIFAGPIAVALATTAGLAAGLLGEGGWDRAAWIGLAVPIVLAARAVRS